MTAINVDGLVALKQYVESLWSRLFHKEQKQDAVHRRKKKKSTNYRLN